MKNQNKFMESRSPPVKPQGPGKGLLLKRILLALVVTVGFLGLLECGLRAVNFHHVAREKTLWKPTVAGFDGSFEFRLQTFFDPPGYLWRTEPNTSYTDTDGFRNPALPRRKAPGKTRIAFLGGSTTQGQRHAYPERAIQILNGALGTNAYEALNVACSAYSTHQSLLALQRWVLDREPNLLCVYHGWNDFMTATDGYSDAEKDALFEVTQKMGAWKRALSEKSRLFQLMAWILEKFDASWPRQRVGSAKFEENLQKMAEICDQHGKKLVIFTRPAFANGKQDEFHDICVSIQQKVANKAPHAQFFDASRVIAQLQELMQAGAWGSQASLFQPDGCHLRPLGEQLLAEQVALFLAPAQAGQITQYLASVEYQLAVGQSLASELQPREAAHFFKKVLEQDPAHPQAQRYLDEATRQFAFADLFWQGCWGGTDEVYESKLAKLKQCLQMRPDDFGVCMQIARVCFELGHAGDAAAAMSGFKPGNQTDRYRWYWYIFNSHVAAQRRPQAIQYARLCLQLDPTDADARAFLRQAGVEIPP